MNEIAVLAVALFFLLMGFSALFAPDRFAAFVGLKVAHDKGTNELHAVYGGFGIAMSAMAAYAVWVEPIREDLLLALSIALLGMVGGRVYSFIATRRFPALGFLAIAVEVAMALALLGAIGAL